MCIITKLSYISNIFPFILLISNIKRFHIQKYKYSSNASLLSRRNLPYVAALLLSRQKCTICQPICGRGRGSLPVVTVIEGRKKVTHSESVSVCLDKPQLLIFAYEFMDVILVKITIIYWLSAAMECSVGTEIITFNTLLLKSRLIASSALREWKASCSCSCRRIMLIH